MSRVYLERMDDAGRRFCVREKGNAWPMEPVGEVVQDRGGGWWWRLLFEFAARPANDRRDAVGSLVKAAGLANAGEEG